jgi:group I intron endonuclease
MNDQNLIPPKPGIYKISFIGSDKIYIGSAVNLNRRNSNHLSDLRNNRHCNIIMQRLYTKYGDVNYLFEIIELVNDKNDLIKREQYFIDILSPEINILQYSHSSLNFKHSKETIKKIELIAQKRSVNPEWIDVVSKTWFKKGKRELTEKQKEAYRKHGEISFKGKTHSIETKLIMSEKARKREKHNTKNLISAPLKKQVAAIINGEKTVFGSIYEFEMAMGMNGVNGSLRRSLLSKGKHFLKSQRVEVSYVSE